MNLLNVKDFDVKETIGSVISKLSWVVKLAMVFKPTPEVKLASAALTLLETIKDKKVSDLTIEEIINIKSAYDAAKPIKEPEKPKSEVKPEPIVDTDIALIKSFTWLDSGDGAGEHGSIVRIYDDNPFHNIANLPVNFNCTLDNGGCHISIPKSDPTGCMGEAGERRAFVCLFNASKQLVCVEDFNGTGIDNRWADKGATHGFVVHILNNKMTSRSNVAVVR